MCRNIGISIDRAQAQKISKIIGQKNGLLQFQYQIGGMTRGRQAHAPQKTKWFRDRC